MAKGYYVIEVVDGEILQVKIFGKKTNRDTFKKELRDEIKADGSESEVIVGFAEIE